MPLGVKKPDRTGLSNTNTGYRKQDLVISKVKSFGSEMLINSNEELSVEGVKRLVVVEFHICAMEGSSFLHVF